MIEFKSDVDILSNGVQVLKSGTAQSVPITFMTTVR